MHSMSKEFYNYLAQRTVDFFQSTLIQEGEKYILNFNDENEVHSFYEALDNLLQIKADIKREYSIIDDDKYDTLGLTTKGNVCVFVVPELNITQAYMTRLRNTIKANWAMLIVACNSIDSISRGTESLSKEGLPFCRTQLVSDIKEKIESSSLDTASKHILLHDLESMNNARYMDSYSITDYSDIIKAIANEKINISDFQSFQLFYDGDLHSLLFNDEKDIDNRIGDNSKLYKQIDDVVRFGDPEHDLAKDFSEDFIKHIIDNHSKQECWSDGITYEEVKKSQRKKEKGEKPLIIGKIYVNADGSPLKENVHYFVKHEAEKGARANNLHILIFNKAAYSEFEIIVEFSDTIKVNTHTSLDSQNATSNTTGKKLIITQHHKGISINRVDLKCTERNNSNFKFSYCIIDCDASWFKDVSTLYLIEAKPKKKQPKSLIINCTSEEIRFNPSAEFGSIIHLQNELELNYDESKHINIVVDDTSFNDENIANASLTINDDVLSIQFVSERPQNTPCSGIRIEQKKLHSKQKFNYWGNNKLRLGTKEYNTQGELKDSLMLEELIIKNHILSCTFYSFEMIDVTELDVSEEIKSAYNTLLDYCVANDTLPSLVYYDDEFTKLASNYLSAVISALSGFEENKPLTKSQQDILRIGVVRYPEKNIIAYSPFHPINVAYQIALAKAANDMTIEIRDDILKKLCADNLLPMVRDDDGELYRILDQKHSPQWTYYYKANAKKNNGSRDFVSVIVKEKITEFYNHFGYLFDSVGNNKIIINAVNMGDCHNLFKGIILYFLNQYGDEKSPDSMLTIIVNVYNDKRVHSVFECLAHKHLLRKFIDKLELRYDKNRLTISELVNCLVSKIKFYSKDLSDAEYDYCHLAFIEMDQKTNEGFSNHNDIRSGTMLQGLVSGVSSTYYGQSHSYRTGYGSKFNTEDETDLIRLSNMYNSAMYVFGQSNPYIPNNVLCTFIDEKETETIEKTYDSSNWVVFIDPKVDLNFFKNADKDIMIIHYSDQHTTSSGYDAITVTRKTEQYANILREYLIENSLPAGDLSNIRSMIDMFNAVNGDWLLKLISSSDNFRKEKISIQSAIKLALAFFYSDNIIWIPIALEEILRVSGAVGLSQNGGLFSAKNLGYNSGATSDDLLLFGVEVREEKVYVHIYPLEVKIGYKNADEIAKATEQIKRTKEIFDTKLTSPDSENSLQYRFYRNFIAQLAVISAEKLNLYNVWSSQDWEKIVNTDVRGKLLNDDFIITNSLHDEIGDGIVISFKEGAFMREVTKSDVTVIKFLKDDGINYLTKSVDDIITTLQNMQDIAGHLFTTQNTIPEAKKPEDASQFDEGKISSNGQPAVGDAAQSSDEAVQESTEQKVAPTIAEKSKDGMKILFGHSINDGKPIYWYPNDTEKVMHPNTGIIGTMGTGKTQFTKSIILQLIQEQNNNPGSEPLGILIFDYKGDYNKNKQDFIDAVGAKVYDLYHLPFNPFSITVAPESKPMLPMHIASTFRETLATAYNLGEKQRATLRDSIMQAYALRGIDKADRSTWTKTPPVLTDVFNAFQTSEAFKEDSLYSALSELIDFEIFETDPNKTMPLYDLINGVTVINLQGYDSSIQNLVVAITLDLFYSQMQVNGHSMIDGKLRQLRKFILVDEADNFLKLGFSSIRKILKEGREFGVGTILSTQFLKHFDTQQDDFSKYILSWIVHKVDDLSPKDVRNLFNTDNKVAEDELFSSIKKLSKHHSFVKLGDSNTPLYIKDRAFWEILEENGAQ